eukprot:CAMPEP_0177710682 /NCGR_PEP_ID=MMETSP0484_2-20121128/11464_1 /TAXON_ID=354590 /ORGANISM="Rhodomonas lens, Strain RHODO" /LENGTH=117 /DNA_ID=CAMNT_0019222377 /DNA_START=14 /DNA_END=367 /DNA_ORIENTATION=+
MSGKADEGDAELRNRAKGEGKEESAATPDAADDSYEFAAVAPDADLPELRVEEGQDIDYRIILIFYLLGDLAFFLCYFLAKEEGYWVIATPFLPLTLWMAVKVYTQMSQPTVKDKKE